MLLPFQSTILLDVCSTEPGGHLFILAKGLGSDVIVEKAIECFDNPKGLVLIIGCDKTKRYLDATTAPLKRMDVYKAGGAVGATEWILLLDLLQGRLEPDRLVGLVIKNAELYTNPVGQLAFAMHILQSTMGCLNKKIFVRAITEAPEQFDNRLERVMRSLFISRVSMYPRFHVDVDSSISRSCPVDICEVKVKMSPARRKCQVLLLDLISGCLRHLLALNPHLDPEQFPLDSVFVKGFSQRVLNQVEATWRTLSPQSSACLQAIRDFKHLINVLFTCVKFMDFRRELQSFYNRETGAFWMSLDSAELLCRLVQDSINTDDVNAKLSVLKEIVEEHDGEIIVFVTADQETFEHVQLTASNIVIPILMRDGDDIAWLDLIKSGNCVLVLNELTLSLIRHIECVKAIHNQSLLKVYYLMYTESVEEQCYLATVRRERAAFERLFNEHAAMPLIRFDLPDKRGECDECDTDGQPHSRYSRLIEQQQDDNNTTDAQQIITFDVRELRSSLPFALYKRFGIDAMVPVTLTTGDYILSDGRVAVERKSLEDLVGSLQSGRLLAQVERLAGEFDIFVLLVELGDPRMRTSPFSTTVNTDPKWMMTRLSILLHHNPRLRIMWSGSDASTVEMFKDASRVVLSNSAGCSAGCSTSTSTTTSTIKKPSAQMVNPLKAALLSLGVFSDKNVNMVINNFDSLRVFLKAGKSELEMKLGRDLGAAVYKQLHLE